MKNDDQSLSQHPAISHMMSTEHWPAELIRVETTIYDPACEPSMGGDKTYKRTYIWHLRGSVAQIDDSVASSLITLAAVRGMAAKGWYTRTRWDGTAGHPSCTEAMRLEGLHPPIRAFSDSDDARSTLKAYQATVMEDVQ